MVKKSKFRSQEFKEKAQEIKFKSKYLDEKVEKVINNNKKVLLFL